MAAVTICSGFGTPKNKVSAKNKQSGTSLMVQWLKLCGPNAGGPGWIPGQGNKSSHVSTTSSHTTARDILHATAKIKDPVCPN